MAFLSPFRSFNKEERGLKLPIAKGKKPILSNYQQRLNELVVELAEL